MTTIINKVKLSPEQTLVVNGLLSLLVTAIMGGASAAYQYYTMHGVVNIGILINIGCITFLILFGKSLHDFVPGHAKDLIQSLQDTYDASQSALQTALQTASIQATQTQAQAMPAPTQAPVSVVIHTTGVPDVQNFAPSVDPLASPLPAHIEVVRTLNTGTTAVVSPLLP